MKLVLIAIFLFLFSVGCKKELTPKLGTLNGGGPETSDNSGDQNLYPKQPTTDLRMIIQP